MITEGKERHTKIWRVFLCWSVCRVAAGLSLMFTTNRTWTQNVNSIFVQMYVVGVAIITEGFPILMVLDWKMVRLMQRERQSFAYFGEPFLDVENGGSPSG